MGNTAVLDMLGPDARNKLLGRSVERQLGRGDILHLAGDRPERVHVIVDGVVKLSLRDAEGEETILGLAAPGALAGDIGAVDGRPQPLDAIAATPVLALGIDAALFVDTVLAHPGA